ncbi:MAG TPA: phosphotransferase [Bryobacteraceae bacterium]|nr:phosphotransferase [Bryobacteraceae bacterium]
MVFELSVENAAEWLRSHSFPCEGARFTELGGGISNKVILAEAPGFRAVLKQSLGQLRTEQGWFSDRARIFREAAAMRWNASAGRVPAVLFEDRETFTIAMEAAPQAAAMWKTQLFQGEARIETARAAGLALGAMISASWRNPEADRVFGDQTVFEQLRIDPYYRFTAERQPQAADYILNLIARSAARRVSLVHGDYSPKNLLVHGDSVWVIDWEVAHFGDPAFDVGFLLNHLLMKTIALPAHAQSIAQLAGTFLATLASALPADAASIIPAAFEHLPALLLARVYGKSPAEYLDAAMRERAAALALHLMQKPASSCKEVLAR